MAFLERVSRYYLAIWGQELIEQLDPQAAVMLDTWLDVISSSSHISDVVSAMRDQLRPTLQLFLEEYACQQCEPVHHLAQRVGSRSLSFNEVTETIMGTYLFGGSCYAPATIHILFLFLFFSLFDLHALEHMHNM
ncbi:hypothetical protein PENSPDRAFT_694946 [Peniophora sp. CONT]|nr:hypothetical protein PENSPDRAFT_694946 [Peniophora sp. CONT]